MPTHFSHPDPSLAHLGLLLLRLAAGGFLLPHALGKLFGWFGGPGLDGFARELGDFGLPARPPLPMLLALLQASIGVLLVMGLFTVYAALAGAGFMAFTASLSRARGWFWMQGGVEYPLLWAGALLSLALLGAGAYALDAVVITALERMP